MASNPKRPLRPLVLPLGLLAMFLSYMVWSARQPASTQGVSVGKSGNNTASVRETTELDATDVKGISEGLTVELTPRLSVAARDTTKSAWPAEVIHDRLRNRLGRMAQALKRTDATSDGLLRSLADGDFACPSLRPTNLIKVYRDAQFSIRRGAEPAQDAHDNTDEQFAFRGPVGLMQALRDFTLPLSGSLAIEIEMKIVRLELDGHRVCAQVLFHGSGRSTSQLVQQNGVFTCDWVVSEDGSAASLLRVTGHPQHYEEIVLADAGARMFSDCTSSVLRGNSAYHEQLIPSINHWLPRIESAFGIDIIAAHGLAVGDANGDGLDDIYFCQPGGLPNCLFVQNPDGTATDASANSRVDFCDASQHALFVDLDNDRDQDLIVILNSNVVFLENDGTGRFAPRGQIRIRLNPNGLAAADVDNDSLLDLYVLNHDSQQDRQLLGNPIPYHDANNGGANVLLKNLGEWRFVDVTDTHGLDQNNRRFTLAASWEDFDNDGDADLYVANDFGRNNLYRNDLSTNGRFVDVAAETGVEDLAAGMSVSWGDYDNDGWMDLYVSNMFSSAGSRVAYQRQFGDGFAGQTLLALQRHARGNTLFRNMGQNQLKFSDLSVAAGVTMGRWAWASQWGDINNDAWLDLVVANGFITNEDTDDL